VVGGACVCVRVRMATRASREVHASAHNAASALQRGGMHSAIIDAQQLAMTHSACSWLASGAESIAALGEWDLAGSGFPGHWHESSAPAVHQALWAMQHHGAA